MKVIIKCFILLAVIFCLSSCGDNSKSNIVNSSSELRPEENTFNVEVSESSNIYTGKEAALFFEDPVVEERIKNALEIKNRLLYPSDLEKIKCMRIDTDYGTGYEFSYDSYEYGDDISTFEWHKFYTLWDRKDSDWDNINNIKTWNDIKHFLNLEYLEMNTSDVRLNYMFYKFNDLEPIGHLVNLKYFVFNKSIFTDLSPINKCKKLQYLSIPCAEVSNLDALKGLSELKEFTYNSNLDLPEDKRLKDISGLEECTKMETLDLAYNEIEDINALSNMKSLKMLDLSANSIKDYSPLENSGNLMTLKLQRSNFENVCFDRGFKNVECLDIFASKNVDINEVSKLINVTTLILTSTKLTDISAMNKMVQLVDLNLSYNKISDFTALQSLINLEILDIADNPVEKLLDFKEFKSLKTIYIDDEYHDLVMNIDKNKTNVYR